MKVAILGAGAWGTALAVSLAPRHKVTLWARDARQIEAMFSTRRNQRYLPDTTLPTELELTSNLEGTLAGAELAIVAVPVAGLRGTLEKIAKRAEPLAVVWLCKGFESATSLLPHQIVDATLPAAFPRGVLSGPSFAQKWRAACLPP